MTKPLPKKAEHPPDIDKFRRRLTQLPKKDLIDMAQAMAALSRRLDLAGPQTDDELYDFIFGEFKLDIPRVAVCDGHTSPFQFIADLYFRRTTAAIAMANRGGSKTFLVALLWYLTGKFRRRVEGLTVGATEAQSKRCYAHLLKMVQDKAPDEVQASIQSETRFKNGSRIEIVPGTVSAVNGPHPQIVHADEVELMDEEVFNESRNMSQSAVVEGRTIPAQDIITSTRKRGHGLMQRLIDEVNEAKIKGHRAPYDVYTWCIFETAAQVKNCRVANPDLPEAKKCQCHKIVKGTWEDESQRTLEAACEGKLFRSRGWIPFDDIVSKFINNPQDVWDAQQTCQKPSTEGLVVPRFNRERFALPRFQPDPDNGPIYQGIDFGGTNPHASLWFQVLRYEIDVVTLGGRKRRLKEGTKVCFDEYYRAEIGNNEFAKMIVRKEAAWRQVYPRFRVTSRFADPQAKAARLDFRQHDPPLPTQWYADRDVKEHIKLLNGLLSDELFFVCSDRCPMFIEEAESWHYPKKKPGMTDDPEKPVEDFDHAMSAWRYGMANVARLEMAPKLSSMPATTERKHVTATRRPVKTSGGSRRSATTVDAWRLKMSGMPEWNG